MGKSSDLEILELGREERNISMAQMMIQKRESVEKIERYTGYALEKLKEISNDYSKWNRDTVNEIADV